MLSTLLHILFPKTKSQAYLCPFQQLAMVQLARQVQHAAVGAHHGHCLATQAMAAKRGGNHHCPVMAAKAALAMLAMLGV